MADLRDVFNWNVKQVFLYLTVEYQTEARVAADLDADSNLLCPALQPAHIVGSHY